jgi:tetratricopeptide (TPR) repeat protein
MDIISMETSDFFGNFSVPKTYNCFEHGMPSGFPNASCGKGFDCRASRCKPIVSKEYMMKTTLKILLAAVVALVCSYDRTCEAHGGGGGGGGGGGRGGFSGGGGGISRPTGGSFDRSPGSNTPRNFTPNNAGGNNINRSNLPSNLNHQNYPDFNRNNINNNINNIHNGEIKHFDNNFVNKNININNFHDFNATRYANGAHPNYGNWYHGDWNGHWNNYWNHPGWYHRPVAWWTAGYIAGAVTAPWSWGYWPYYNPYCGEVVVVGDTTIDYSQPIALADAGNSASANTDQAMTWLDAARKAFYRQDYPTALKSVEQALALAPSDPVMNEVRGLTLFSTKKFKDAAGVIYAVLSAGPGWDWATMIALYPSVGVYTNQLRALEEHVKANPDDAAARFLLAYHYLTCGHNDAAASQLKKVVALNPQDTLSSQLLQGLSDKEPPAAPAPQDATSTPAAPATQAVTKPVDAAKLVGAWKSTRADGSTFALTLTDDGKFNWKYTQKGKTQEYNGPYTVADNLLILKQNDNPVMVGKVSLTGENQFNFKLPGENPSDPGLTFEK